MAPNFVLMTIPQKHSFEENTKTQKNTTHLSHIQTILQINNTTLAAHETNN